MAIFVFMIEIAKQRGQLILTRPTGKISKDLNNRITIKQETLFTLIKDSNKMSFWFHIAENTLQKCKLMVTLSSIIILIINQIMLFGLLTHMAKDKHLII